MVMVDNSPKLRRRHPRGADDASRRAFGRAAWTALWILLFPHTAWAQPPVVFDPIAPPAESIRQVFMLVLAVSGVIFLLVGGTLLVFIFRFRQRPDDPPTEPPQIYGSQPIELAWTVAPLLIVLVLSLVVIRSVVEMRAEEPSAEGVQVRVVGHQWWWEFEYPTHGFTTAGELVIPASDVQTARPIYLQLESADVIHSFWAPRLAGKTDLIPAQTNQMWIQADAEGTYFGRCAEYCGTQHAKMLFRVIALPTAEYDQWVAAQQQPAVNDPAVEPGRQIFLRMACANCHTIRGTTAVGRFGPDLTHLMSRQTLASAILPNDRDTLARWLADPQTLKQGCRMPNMRLSDRDVQLLTDYLVTLK